MVHRALSASLIAMILGSFQAGAIEFRSGQSVTIPAGQVIDDDLYVTGDSVVIDGVVEGDIVAIGRNVVLNGASLGDFIAAGQAIAVNGQVADDVRIAGFALRLGDAAAVGDDVIAAGFSLEARPDSLIAGGVVFSGFQALLAGEVRERILGQMASLRIEGIVLDGGEVAVEGGESTPPFVELIPSAVSVPHVPAGLTIGPDARVQGEIVYTSPVAAVEEGESRGTLTHIEVAAPGSEEIPFLQRAVSSVWRFVSVLVIGMALLLLAPGWLRRRSTLISDRPVATAGSGVAFLLGLPVLLLLFLVLVILVLVLLGYVHLPALPLLVVCLSLLASASAVAGLIVSVVLVGPAIVALWLGRTLMRSETGDVFLGLGIGWVVLAAVFLVPFVGAVARFVVAVVGLGAVVLWAFGPLVKATR